MSAAPADLLRPERVRLGFLWVPALLLVLAGVLARALGWDVPWMLAVHARAPSHFAAIFWSCLTVAGLGWAALVLVLAADRCRGRLAALLVPTFLVGSVLTHIPKWLVAAPRPAGTDIAAQLHIIGTAFRGQVSMPSGHALTAAAVAALLCLCLSAARRPWLALPVCAVAVLVAFSRIVVGAHWPSDVLVGAGLGLAAVALCVAVARTGRGRTAYEALANRIATRAGQRWVAAAEVASAVGLFTERTGYPLGQPMVNALALAAFASAVLRWRALREPRTVPPLAKAPVEHT